MIKVRAANPGPAHLLVLNPTRRRKTTMKRTRRRTKRRTARRTVARSAAPLRRTRRRSTRRRAVARKTNGIFSFLKPRRRARRVGNNRATRRRRVIRHRHRNPGGLFAKGFALAAAAAGLQFALMWVPPIGGVSAIADAARTAGLGWLAGIAMRKTGLLSRFADDVTLAGFTLAGGKLITSLVLPLANRVFTSVSSGGEMTQQMMPPAGMQGIATYNPTAQPFRHYQPVGMRGIALYDPNGQPFSQYALVA